SSSVSCSCFIGLSPFWRARFPPDVASAVPRLDTRVSPRMKRLARNLTFQVLCAVALGALLGALDPALGRAMRPVCDTFVKLVQMVIGPIIFLTIVLGISNIADLKKVGRGGGKGLL